MVQKLRLMRKLIIGSIINIIVNNTLKDNAAQA